MYHHPKNTIQAFLNFLKSPFYDIRSDAPFSEKLKTFISLFFLELALVLGLMVTYKILTDNGLFPGQNNKVLIFIKNIPNWFAILMIVLISPFVEEVFFRLHLRTKPKYITLNLIIVFTGLLLIILSLGKTTGFRISVLVIYCIAVILCNIWKQRISQVLLNFFRNKFIWVFYVTATLFALAHINNYKLNTVTLMVLPVLVFPQFLMGLFFGYTRLKLGFGWGCTFHALHNFIIVIPLLITTFGSFSKKYSIRIEEQDKVTFLYTERITPDTVEFDHLKIEDIFPKLLMTNKKHIVFEDSKIAGKVIKLNFERDPESRKGIIRSSNSIVIAEILKKYDLKMKQEYIEREKYDLQIDDSVKLYLCFINSSDTLKSDSSVHLYGTNDKLLYNADIKLIAFNLGNYFNKDISCSSTNHDKFNIRIPDIGFNELNDYITNEYGLYLKKSIGKVRVIKISSAKGQKDTTLNPD
jgi:membrane protease YdiL (CAAX protease family)